MKEFINKLIAKLEKLSIPIYDSDGEIENKVVFTDIAKNIVNELAEKYKNTNIITDFLQYARDNADNYDTNEGWSLADLIDLSIKYSEEYINTSTDTSTTNADRIRSMNDEKEREANGKV